MNHRQASMAISSLMQYASASATCVKPLPVPKACYALCEVPFRRAVSHIARFKCFTVLQNSN